VSQVQQSMAAVGEVGTTPGVNYLSQFFTHYPRDERWAILKSMWPLVDRKLVRSRSKFEDRSVHKPFRLWWARTVPFKIFWLWAVTSGTEHYWTVKNGKNGLWTVPDRSSTVRRPFVDRSWPFIDRSYSQERSANGLLTVYERSGTERYERSGTVFERSGTVGLKKLPTVPFTVPFRSVPFHSKTVTEKTDQAW